LTYGAIVLSLLIAIVYYFSGDNVVVILKTITSAAVTVVPEGLLLASSLLLAFGSLRLAQAKVLPQKLSAIEAMALLNLLAVDKTGTLTSDEVTLEKVAAFGDENDYSDSDIASFAALIAHETSGGNITGRAILSEATSPKNTKVLEVMAFSSARKMAGVRANIDGEIRTLIMGAPEFVLKLAPVDEEIQKKLNDWADNGLRVLMLADNFSAAVKSFMTNSPLAFFSHHLFFQAVSDLAFFKRGGKGKVIVDGTSLAHPSINKLAIEIRDLLREKPIVARQLKTLLIRSDQQGNTVWQLYVKDKIENLISDDEAKLLSAAGGEIIYSDPKSPASRITERLNKFGDTTLSDTILGVAFNYACEGFFQVNIPVYEKALSDMKAWINCNEKMPTLDLYSGVGTIDLTIGGDDVTLVEINEHAIAKMQRNITKLNRPNAKAILAPSEKSLEYITGKQIVIVDPPRAGLHADVTNRLLETEPPRIIYLSCNPVTQARDVSLLQEKYEIVHHQGYNFFPRTPHIEHLVVLDKKA
jgi:16S rRNA G966 N2-methylase RsmD